MTIRKLLEDIKKEVLKDKTILDKKVLLSDDDEGNGYHEMFFTITSKEDVVKEAIECSNGVSNLDITDYGKYVILG